MLLSHENSPFIKLPLMSLSFFCHCPVRQGLRCPSCSGSTGQRPHCGCDWCCGGRPVWWRSASHSQCAGGAWPWEQAGARGGAASGWVWKIAQQVCVWMSVMELKPVSLLALLVCFFRWKHSQDDCHGWHRGSGPRSEGSGHRSPHQDPCGTGDLGQDHECHWRTHWWEGSN